VRKVQGKPKLRKRRRKWQQPFFPILKTIKGLFVVYICIFSVENNHKKVYSGNKTLMNEGVMEKFYYAVIKKDGDAYSVTFPDIDGCFTQGYSMEEAILMAEDALAAILEVPGRKDIKASDFETVNKTYGGKDVYIMKIDVRPDLMFAYSDKVKRNISFSFSTLEKIDTAAKKLGLNRSALIDRAANEFISHVQS
jgi:predicted RNase H-like HicB family nuclease